MTSSRRHGITGSRLPLLLLLLVLVLLPAARAQACLNVDEANDFRLWWSVDQDAATVTMTMQAAARGYIAVGIYPTTAPDMHPDEDDGVFVDLWAASGAASGAKVFDFYMRAKEPASDTQDLTATEVTRNATHTTATFTRPLVTGDSLSRDYDLSDLDKTWKLVYACGSKVMENAQEVPKHSMSCYGAKTFALSMDSQCDVVAGNGAYTSPAGDFELTFTPNTATGMMDFVARAMTTGWLAFGFGPSAHTQSDMFMLSVAGTTVTADDTYSTGFSQPTSDASQDLTAVTGDETGGWTTVSFSRPLDTGDARDVVISDTSLLLQWAYCASSDAFSSKHTNTGTVTVNLLSGDASPLPEPSPLPSPQPGGGTVGNGVYESPAGDFRVEFAPNAADASLMDFSVSAATTGWFSLGFGAVADGEHIGSDMIMMSVAGTTVTLQDMLSNDFAMPTADASQDITAVSGEVLANGMSSVSFTRALDTGDASDVAIADSPLLLQWAYAGNGATSFPTKHVRAGKVVLNLLSGETVSPTPLPAAGEPGVSDLKGGLFKSSGGHFQVAFAVDSAGETIEMEMSGATTGWISVGWAKDGNSAHQATDMIVGWVDGTGQGTLVDTMSSSKTRPADDGSNDVTLLSASESGGRTTIRFSRPVVTGDGDDVDIENAIMSLQWAIASSDNPASFHSDAGVGSVNFFTGETTVGGDCVAGFICDSGVGLTFTVGMGLLIYCIVRFTYKAIKYHKRRKLLKEIKLEEANEAGEAKKADDRTRLAPDAGGYFRGSVFVESGDVQSHMAEETKGDAMTPVGLSPPSRLTVTSPKKDSSRASDCWHVIKTYRVPMTRIKLYEAMAMTMYMLVNLAWAAFFVPSSWAFEDSLGYLAAANGLLLALPATRNSVLAWLLGIHFDHTIAYHRWLGRWTFGLASMHQFLYWDVWRRTHVSAGEAFSNGKYLFGTFSWVCMVVIMISSIERFRRQSFNIFYWLHYFFIGFYVLGALHSKAVVPYFVAAAVFYGLDKLIRFAWGLFPRRTISLTLKDETLVRVEFPKLPLRKYELGQYVFLNFPAISLTEWHPYTLSSGCNENSSEVHIKGLGDHTKQLLEKAKQHERLWIRIDGPYGGLSVNYRRYNTLVLVAGGVGVTPMIAILKHLYHYNIALEKQAKMTRPHVTKVFFVWSVPALDVYRWFADELRHCVDASRSDGFPSLNAQVYVTRGELDGDDAAGLLHKGRPDIRQILAEAGESGKTRVGVYACGPQRMVNAVWDGSVGNSGRFDLHTEIFDF